MKTCLNLKFQKLLSEYWLNLVRSRVFRNTVTEKPTIGTEPTVTILCLFIYLKILKWWTKIQQVQFWSRRIALSYGAFYLICQCFSTRFATATHQWSSFYICRCIIVYGKTGDWRYRLIFVYTSGVVNFLITIVSYVKRWCSAAVANQVKEKIYEKLLHYRDGYFT